MFAKRCFSCAWAANGRKRTSATKWSLVVRCIVNGKGDVNGDELSSGASLYQRIDAFFLALPAGDNAAKSADDADECPAICARVALGSTLLVLA